MSRKNISYSTKKEVWEKCSGRCWYCGKSLNPFFVHYDHVIPYSKGGEDSVDNLVTACPPCNNSKKDLDVWEWRLKVSREMGLALSKQQINILKSEGINPMDDPYQWEPPLLFYFERDYFKDKTPEAGYYKVYNVINFKGWTA